MTLLEPQWKFLSDSWSMMFVGLIAWIGFFVLAYAHSYFHDSRDRLKFFPAIIAFALAMIGVVTFDDLILLFLAWEATSLISYFLIAFDPESPKARKSALQALVITGSGGLALLAALVLIYQQTGTLSLTVLLSQPELLIESPELPWIAGLVILASFTKSAQFPFHFWLPGAMTAPTPVSSFLHSATMVKAGIYLLYRFEPLLSSWWLFKPALVSVGLGTFAMMSFRSYFQKDLKSVVAFTTAGALGLMTALIGWGTETSLRAVFLFVIAHGLYKASLFFLVGHLDHQTSSKEVGAHYGLRQVWPKSFTVSIFALMAALGAGPFLGFVAKETFLFEFSHFTWVVILGLLFNNFSTCWIALRPYLGEKISHPHSQENFGLLWPVLGLTLTHLALGITISLWSPQFFGSALHLWHGFNLPLATSLVLLLATLWMLKAPVPTSPWSFHESPRFFQLWDGHLSVAKLWTQKTQNGSLTFYLFMVFAGACFLLMTHGSHFSVPSVTQVLGIELLIAIMVLTASVFLMIERRVFPLVLGLSLVGSAASLYFIYFGALDLAMTQLAVEALSLLFFVMVLKKVPHLLDRAKDPRWDSVLGRITRWSTSVLSGGLVFWILWVASSTQHPSQLRQYFAENSLPLGHGANVVNVILVDFRGLDTMGEITVLGIAAIGIWWMISKRTER
ncbi:MAG: DUF4040 domain-containing protein [Proteobacteria bacterium]|jgi:multicomponent Na+:H+ antiporter subunit A|nr:DUF4040 domain-containing protein [Pseudomonadota bacterium]